MQAEQGTGPSKGHRAINKLLIDTTVLSVGVLMAAIVYAGFEGRVAKLDAKCHTVGMNYSFHHGLCVERGTGRMLDPKSMS